MISGCNFSSLQCYLIVLSLTELLKWSCWWEDRLWTQRLSLNNRCSLCSTICLFIGPPLLFDISWFLHAFFWCHTCKQIWNYTFKRKHYISYYSKPLYHLFQPMLSCLLMLLCPVEQQFLTIEKAELKFQIYLLYICHNDHTYYGTLIFIAVYLHTLSIKYPAHQLKK